MDNNDLVPGFDDARNENLSITLQDVPTIEHCLLVTLNGYIDTYNAAFFQEQGLRAVGAGFIRLIFDCGDLASVSSAGIGAFTVLLKAVKARDGDLLLFGMTSHVYEVFQLLGVSPFFTIKETFADSAAFFRGAEPETAAVFPRVFPCPTCSKKLKATQSGRFRCPDCKTILSVDSAGRVFVG